MTELVLTGDVEIAISHFALVGLASIVQAETDSPTRVWWRDGMDPEPVMCSELSPVEVGEVVRQHANRLSSPESWLRARFTLDVTKRGDRSLFAPRAQAPAGREGWARYEAERRAGFQALSLFDQEMVEGLGEPAWWRISERESRPDDGASRWEMAPRNAGREMVTHRLLPLAKACGARSPGQVVAGLRGESVVDETGSALDSRSGGGLMPPGAVDTAVAWCALWTLTQLLPTAARTGVSASPGVGRVGVTHPTVALIPVFTTPTAPRRWGQIMRSAAFARCLGSSGDEVADVASRSWLREQGVAGVLRCAIHKGGSSSAPERWLQPGHVEVWS